MPSKNCTFRYVWLGLRVWLRSRASMSLRDAVAEMRPARVNKAAQSAALAAALLGAVVLTLTAMAAGGRARAALLLLTALSLAGLLLLAVRSGRRLREFIAMLCDLGRREAGDEM